MTPVLAAITRISQEQPEKIALEGAYASLGYEELKIAIGKVAEHLGRYASGPVGLLADNSPAWAVVDIAAQAAKLPLVPLPTFFSDAQIRHIARDAGISLIVSDRSLPLVTQTAPALEVAGTRLECHQLSSGQGTADELPPGISKVTYTSGTTGAPKNVCLDLQGIMTVSESLRQRSGATGDDRHLCLTPLSILLENIAGLYTPLLAGATCCLLPMAQVGLLGTSGIDVGQMFHALNRTEATSAILIPQTLRALVEGIEKGLPRPSQLRFLAVGGAPVSESLLKRAEACGLPVYQGYGLSECASVVALNGPGANRVGSVGKPLPHVKIEFADDGEILVNRSMFTAYLGAGITPHETTWPTGDIGHLDEAGFLYITGRKKSIFITSFGRNVAPEWVERELCIEATIMQAAVFGEGRPYNTAVIVSSHAATAEGRLRIEAAIDNANLRLPDYARISRWVAADEPFSFGNGQLTNTGRLRREQIYKAYGATIESQYEVAAKGTTG